MIQESKGRRIYRQFMDRGFAAAAFSATFAGLLVLVFLFWQLAADTVTWFQTTPQAIQAHQAQVAETIQNDYDESLAQVDREMHAELEAAASAEEQERIRQEYDERIRPRIKANLDLALKERTTFESGLRTDTSANGVLKNFLLAGPSSEPSEAGVYPALLGSIYLGIITIFVAVPVGVAAAVYLEEYRQTKGIGRIIQVNINNLAGVPSVVYGILGAFLFVEMLFKNLEGELYTPYFLTMILGQSAADGFMKAVFGESIAARNVLGGGLTLALLTLPIVIVSTQEALRAVPVSLRHAAMALGATRWQVIWHHVLPQARPGILTGVILALSRAIGEAAPLVMFGALLFVSHDPTLFSRFTVLPMQIFGWIDRPADAWRYNAALASVILIVVLLGLNSVSIYLRYRAQRMGR